MLIVMNYFVFGLYLITRDIKCNCSIIQLTDVLDSMMLRCRACIVLYEVIAHFGVQSPYYSHELASVIHEINALACECDLLQ